MKIITNFQSYIGLITKLENSFPTMLRAEHHEQGWVSNHSIFLLTTKLSVAPIVANFTVFKSGKLLVQLLVFRHHLTFENFGVFY